MASSDDDGIQIILHEPNTKLSKEAHSKIRRHAMRAVGAARRRSDDAAPPRRRGHPPPRRDLGGQPHPMPPMPLSGLELMVKDHGLDPMDLSALTSVHMAAIASSMLQSEPSQLPNVLLCRQQSYFSFVPPRFGQSVVLDDAFRCLITMAHSMLVPAYRQRDEIILANYGKALRSLQSAVNEPSISRTADVLCAVAMLALCELLSSPNGQLWTHHIAGASRLIQARGPENFTSEFDRALLMALGIPICAEALLNNENCFLEEPAWTQAFQDAMLSDEMFTDRSPLGITLVLLMAKIPSLAKRTNHAIATQDALAQADFDAIVADVRVVRSAILTWRRDFNTALIHAAAGEPEQQQHYGSGRGSNKATLSKRYELLGMGLVIHMLATRMLVCLVPGGERALLEEEVQNLALELKTVQGTTAGPNHRAAFFLAQKAKIADAVIATHANFAGAAGSDKVVELWVLKSFCAALGRKCCDGVTCCL